MRRTIEKALRAAMHKGCDPYNSHEAAAREAHRIEARKLRAAAERAAEREWMQDDPEMIPMFLRRQAD